MAFEPFGSVFVVFAEDSTAATSITSVARYGKEIIAGAEIRLSAGGDAGIEAEVWQPGAYGLKFADGRTAKVDVPEIAQPVAIDGPWEVRFAPGGGAPDRVTLNQLASWSDNPNPGVEFYSGTATYTKTFSLSSDLIGNDRGLWLDLGKVEVMAEVKLNGESLGILWRPPYRVDIAGAAKSGENKLEVKVANLWVNRQIGDEFLPEDSDRNPDGTLKAWPKWLLDGKSSPTGRISFTSWRLWHKDDHLQPSGLLGPVEVMPTVRRTVTR
jgi:hypothetical protein